MAVSYRSSGVDLDAGDALVRRIAGLAKSTRRDEVVSSIGGFGAAFRLPRGLKSPLLVAATDGVGTKLRLAFELDRHDTIGIDLVAMNANDVLSVGAEPLVFLDYLGTGRLDVDRAAGVIRGIATGCRRAGCALVGGETAEMPGSYPAGEYDLAGFVVGVVERQRLLDGRRIRPGHVVLGLSSAGLHSNGFSLVRRIVEKRRLPLGRRVEELGRTLGEELLKPTRIYVRAVLPVLRRYPVDGVAHVTGGGIPGNLPRILPPGCRAEIERGSWSEPRIFHWLARNGPVEEAEMDRTFNRGLGLLLVVRPSAVDRVVAELRRRRARARVVGRIVRGSPGVTYV